MARIVMLVANPGSMDARVCKEAEALVAAGHEVTVGCRLMPGYSQREVINGVTFRRFDLFAPRAFDKPTLDRVFKAFGPLADETRQKFELWTAAALAAEKAEAKYAEAQRAREIHSSSREVAVRLRTVREQRAPVVLAWRETNTATRFFIQHALFACHLMELADEAPHVVHAHDVYMAPAGVALGRYIGARVIYDAHEIETERVPPLPPDRKAFVAAIEQAVAPHLDGMIVVCGSAAKFYREMIGVEACVVMNAPDLAEIEGPDIRTMLPPLDGPLIVYTGGVGLETRGLQHVVPVLKELGAHLAILGPRNASDVWLFDLADALGVRDRLHPLPPVPQAQVVCAIRSADVAVCPIQDVSLSYRYSMPNKLFEAAFAGVPICVSNLPEMSAFVRRLKVGEVMDQTNPDDIARTIRKVLSNRKAYETSPTAKRLLETEYAWPNQASRLVEFYDLVLSGSSFSKTSRSSLAKPNLSWASIKRAWSSAFSVLKRSSSRASSMRDF